MAVKDFMTRKVVYISPDTTIAHAADLMREQGLHRLPVIENDKLVGLVTEGTIAEASPSKATSLSIFEMNYLLNKTKVKDVMLRDVITVSKFASLEDATYLMYKNKVGILPVVDNFERGLAAVPEEEKSHPFMEGMDKIYKQLMTTLGEAGVKPIEAVGQEFNPDFHNAVMHVEDEEVGENIVVEEFQKGYTYRDSVVRHSMVKVAN